jgi:hypothetical protein
MDSFYNESAADSAFSNFLNYTQTDLNANYYSAKPNLPDGITKILKVKLGNYSAFKAIRKCEFMGKACRVQGDVLYVVF